MAIFGQYPGQYDPSVIPPAPIPGVDDQAGVVGGLPQVAGQAAQAMTPPPPAPIAPLRPRIQMPTAPQGSSEWQQQRQQVLEEQAFQRQEDLNRQIERQKLTPWADLGIGGKIGRVAGTIGGIVAPRITSRIPGTPLYSQARTEQLETEADRMAQLQTQEEEAQARMITALTAKRGQPTVIQDPNDPTKTILAVTDPSDPTRLIPYTVGGQTAVPAAAPEKERWQVVPGMVGAGGVPIEMSTTGEMRLAPVSGVQPLRPGTLPHITIMQPDRKAHVMGLDPTTGQYSIDLGEAPPTTPVQGPQEPVYIPRDPGDYSKGFDVATAREGGTVPGTAMSPQAAEKAAEQVRVLQGQNNWAQDYLKEGKFSGAGDFALVMGYVDAIKTTGFRFNYPEQTLLLNRTVDMVDGIRARIKRAFNPNAPLLDDNQRKNFVETMTRALQAKPGMGGGAAPAVPSAGGQTQREQQKYQKGDQYVFGGRLREFQGGANTQANWKDLGPAPAGAPSGIYIPPLVTSPIQPRQTP